MGASAEARLQGAPEAPIIAERDKRWFWEAAHTAMTSVRVLRGPDGAIPSLHADVAWDIHGRMQSVEFRFKVVPPWHGRS